MGYYLYGGVEMREVPQLNLKEYPFWVIRAYGTNYSILCSKEPSIFYVDSLLAVAYTPAPYLYSYIDSTGAWSEVQEKTEGISWTKLTTTPTAVWSNFDMADSDGNVILAASDPVYVGEYRSEQYKYLLIRQLQKYFSMPNAKDRYYTRDFFQKLFEGIEVTETSYNEFVDVLEDNMRYCAANNVKKEENITQAMIDDHSLMLVKAFEKIGITLVIEKKTYSGSATFTKPGGTMMVYNVTDSRNNFFINAVCGQEYGYAKKASPYYQMRGAEVKELSGENYQMCGPDCYWSYDANATTMTITGTGTYEGVTMEEQMGSGSYTTLIFGAEVSELNYNEAYNSSALTTIVLLQPADFPLLISKFDGSTNERMWTVYTDNEAFRNHAWGDKLTINWHTLDEWEG